MKKIFKSYIKPLIQKNISVLYFLMGTLFVLSVFFIGMWQWGERFELPKSLPSPGILDRNGEVIGEILNNEKMRYVEIPVDGFPSILVDGLIQLEDRHFYEHMGVSPSSIIRSTINNIKVTSGMNSDGNMQGGSTLTMWLARNVLGINRKRGISEKLEEVLLAIRIEIRYSKQEILAAYLNRVHFGRLAIGIGSASEAYLGKSLSRLTPAETIALLSLIKNPTVYDPIKEPEAFIRRVELVRVILVNAWIISKQDWENMANEPLLWTRPKTELPYVSDLIKSIERQEKTGILDADEVKTIQNTTQAGLPIVTSIDLGLTRKVGEIAEAVRTWLQFRNVSDYGILMVDRKSMKVRVLIGGANYSGNAGQVNAVFAPRQVGSTIKPFTYLLGITEKWHAMSDTILDAPAGYLTADGNPYEPKNYSLRYRGTITLAEALAGSVNVPAVKIAHEVGVETLLKFIQSLGVTSLKENADHYGLALTLGVGEISLWELLRAYTIFSDAWKFHNFSLLESTENTTGKTMEPPEAISQIVTTLSSHEFKSEEFPLGSALDFGEGKVFVKTGTSRNFRDNYAIGFTENYLIGIWTGNKDGTNMRGVSGATGAWEIFAGIVTSLGENIGNVQAKSELSNTTPSQQGKVENTGITISNPLNGTTYLLDKNTPIERQNITIKYWSQNPYQKIQYFLIPLFWSQERRELIWGKLPIGKLTPWKYEVLLVGEWNGKMEQASSFFEVQ